MNQGALEGLQEDQHHDVLQRAAALQVPVFRSRCFFVDERTSWFEHNFYKTTYYFCTYIHIPNKKEAKNNTQL